MKIHHLNCGTFCPVGGALYDGVSKGLSAHLACHCLLIETNRELILIDTGLGVQDVEAPASRMANFFLTMMRPPLRMEETAFHQIKQLGFNPTDVRHIVLTHLDFDHAGGLEDFPWATVHVNGAEYQAATHRKGFITKRRYRPQQFDEIAPMKTYSPGGENWFGFNSIRNLEGIQDDIFLIPLIGHTWGHCGVAVRDHDRWLLHAGDAYFYRGEMNPDHPTCTPGLRFYQWMMEVDRGSRLHNQKLLRQLIKSHGHEVRVISAHDPVEFERARHHGLNLPSDNESTVQPGLSTSPFGPAHEHRSPGKSGLLNERQP